MLSTLSSFLPAALSDKLDKLELRTDDLESKEQADNDGVKRRDMIEDSQKKEKKKKSSSNETFIVVRPPPAKSNHPLNLQLQLVPAHHSRDRANTAAAATPTGSRFSLEAAQGNDSNNQAAPQFPPSPSASESEHPLKRTPSSRSETSAFYASSAAATGSVTSFASTTSTSSGRRMIIPLYNLSAHNVMTNTILDAGTDARVAKFLKRGLEMIDLAILEPTEVWHGKELAHGAGVGATADPLGVPIRRSVSGNSSLVPPGQNGSRAGTPDPLHSPGSSRLSISSERSGSAPHDPAKEPVNTPTATPTGARKLFGRMFRKKETSGSSTRNSPSISLSTAHPAAASPPQATVPLPDPRAPTPSKPVSSEVLLPAVLGLQPTLSAATNPPTGRCISYIWIVRKWLKVENQGLISGVLGKIGREASSHGIGHAGMSDPTEWEVRFEWTRAKSKSEKSRRTKRRTSADVDAHNGLQTPSRRGSVFVDSEDGHKLSHANDGVAISIDSPPRQSLDVKRPPSRASSPGRGVSGAASVASDDETAGGHGDDSDPEDSETPWTCTMFLTHTSAPLTQPASVFTKGHSRTRTISSSGAARHPAATHAHAVSESGHGAAPAPVSVKIKVATLSPAPHHPKVVCQLKIPFPLPDAEVDHGILRKRLVLADGSTRSTVPANGGSGAQSLTLTAEEIKDVVCSTAFWLVVREGFGGVGKKNRKGDGWKIRG